jgi:hypothetical protein
MSDSKAEMVAAFMRARDTRMKTADAIEAIVRRSGVDVDVVNEVLEALDQLLADELLTFGEAVLSGGVALAGGVPRKKIDMRQLVLDLSTQARDRGAKAVIIAIADAEGRCHIQTFGNVLETEGLRSLMNRIVEPIIDRSAADQGFIRIAPPGGEGGNSGGTGGGTRGTV